MTGSDSNDWMDSGLFAEVDDAARAALSEAAERREIPGGAYLVRQGEAADALYFVETGRFRVLIETDAGTRMVAQIDAGEPVGELAFFGGGTRTATLQASRDSVVMALDRASYDRVVARHPALADALLKSVSQRLAAVTARTSQVAPRPPRVLAFVDAGGSALPADLIDRVAHAMRIVLPADRDVAVVREGDVPPGSASAYQAWLRERESKRGYILVDTRGDDQWAALACRNADGMVMLADPSAASIVNPVEAMAMQSIEPVNRTLALVRTSRNDRISGTAAWLAGRDPHLHHHLALDRPSDLAKLARFLTGRAVGLVLAGGGALGCAHLGIVRGLQKADIPIDYIGGTSAGAAMGAAIAQGLGVAETLDQMEAMFIHAKAMKRLTLPVHSLLDPHVFDAELRSRYGEQDIVDQPIGFFAISTNLSTNALHVHRRGPLWQAVRASGSLPTILPPFIDHDGNILVDGGVLDNIPVTTMREVKTGPNIVVTLGDANQAWRIRAAYESIRSRGRLLVDFLLRRKASDDFPSIVEVMQRSMVVASRIASRSMLREGDIMLTPPIIPGMQILDWHLGRKQAQLAAEYVAQQVEENDDLCNILSK
ncbi:MAG: patatin-like phospholipase family protein [Blastomonas sp.]